MRKLILAVPLLLLSRIALAVPGITICDPRLATPNCATVTDRGQLLVVFAEASTRWTCTLTGLEATLTQCQAGDPAKQYRVTEIFVQATTVNAATFALQSGTGTNCGTATTPLTPGGSTSTRWSTAGTGGGVTNIRFQTPLAVTLGHSICAIGQNNNASVVQVVGYW